MKKYDIHIMDSESDNIWNSDAVADYVEADDHMEALSLAYDYLLEMGNYYYDDPDENTKNLANTFFKSIEMVYYEEIDSYEPDYENAVIMTGAEILDPAKRNDSKESVLEPETKKYQDEYLLSVRKCKQDLLSSDGGISAEYEARKLDDFLTEMSCKHGFDNVALIITNHVKTQIWDGRYSPDVKKWAEKQPEFKYPPKQIHEYTLGSTHPVIVDSACRWVMENEKNKDAFLPHNTLSPYEELIKKMSDELQNFKDYLLSCTPGEVLDHAYEYTTKVDIVEYIEAADIEDKSVDALLSSSSPLEDIFTDILKKEPDIEDSIKETIEYLTEEKAPVKEQLYNKMSTEQDKYKGWLLSQSPEEILNHTYEYTVRNDILLFMEDNPLSDEQAKFLLDNSCSLSDLYKDFEKLESSFAEDITSVIEDRISRISDNSKDFFDETKA